MNNGYAIASKINEKIQELKDQIEIMQEEKQSADEELKNAIEKEIMIAKELIRKLEEIKDELISNQ